MNAGLVLLGIGLALGYLIGYLRGWMRGVEHTRTYIDAQGWRSDKAGERRRQAGEELVPR